MDGLWKSLTMVQVFNEEKLREIENRLKNMKNDRNLRDLELEGLGIANIYARLRMFFGIPLFLKFLILPQAER